MDGYLGIDKRKLSLFFEQQETVLCFFFPLPAPGVPHFVVLRFYSREEILWKQCSYCPKLVIYSESSKGFSIAHIF